jgi:nitroreductase
MKGLQPMIHELIQSRRSPRAFSEKPVALEILTGLLEAARWAPSCSNEQPWSFIVTAKPGDDYTRLLSCLVPFNAEWAQQAPVLLLAVARSNFAASGKPNRHAMYDVGQSMTNLSFQATASGLVVHQMAGFDVEKARQEFSIPADQEPAAVAAIGYPGDVATLNEKLRAREAAPRTRKPLHDFVFTGRWGQPAPWIGSAK